MAQTEKIKVDDQTRAEDILLGALGFDETAHIVTVTEDRGGKGYSGKGCFEDGEEFEFASEDPLTDLEHWALSIMRSK